MKLGACPPLFCLVGDGMFGSLSLAFVASPFAISVPLLDGGVLISQQLQLCDRG